MVAFVAWSTLNADATEFYPSLKAARAAHPREHITWSHGQYFVGYPSRKRELARGGPKPSAAQKKPAAVPAPPPADVSASSLLALANEIRWRGALISHFDEWESVRGKSRKFQIAGGDTFSERFASAVSAR
jgi:hypothetical protein